MSLVTPASSAALNEAAMLVANADDHADDPAAARALVGTSVERLLARL